MKKLVVISHAGVLEVNRTVYEMLPQVSDVQVHMVVPQSWKGDLIRKLQFDGHKPPKNVFFHALPIFFSGNGSLYFYGKNIKKIQDELKPDIVFLDEEPWSLSALQGFRNFKQSTRCFFTKQNIQKKLPFPFSKIERKIFDQSDFAFAVASEVETVLRKKGYNKDIRILPHSYDPDIFKALSQEKKIAQRNRLGLPLGATVVTYFGRLTSEKGIEEILECMSKGLKVEALNEVFFWIVGNGPLYGTIEKWIKEGNSNRVRLTPAIPHREVGSTLACADILVLPSRTTPRWKEQFGRILVEAMACGLAVMGSDSGEIPHLIRKTGGGMVFQERNSNAMLNTLQKMVSDKRYLENYKNTGRKYVESHLSHLAVARDLAGSLGFSPHKNDEKMQPLHENEFSG